MAKKNGANGSRTKRHTNLENIKYNPYNYSSMAYDYAVEEQEYDQRQVVRRKKKKGTKKQLKYVRSDHAAKNFAASTYLTIIVVFACAFTCLLSTSNINAKERELLILNSELKTLKDKTAELTMEVAQTMDLEQIDYIARTKLQMSEPQAHQIYYISVPKQNYTVYYSNTTYDDGAVEPEKNSFSLSSIKKLFNKD